MPGMMISRDSRKYQLRRLTKSIFRTRGGAGGVSTRALATSSSAVALGSSASSPSSSTSSSSSSSGRSVPTSPARVSSDGSDTVHPHQRRTAECAARHDDGQQVVSYDDRRDEAGKDADPEHDSESFHRPRPDEAEDRASDQRRQVGISNRRPGTAHPGVDGRRDRPARAHLFLEPFEDQNVGVDRHAYREDEPGDAGQRERDGYDFEHCENRTGVEEQREAREEPWHAVVDDHEQHHDR